MGTEFQIILYTSDAETARRASDAAFARVAQLNAILSDYDPESEAMRLCARAGDGQYVDVSAELFTVLERSLALAEKTGGAFDPTVGPVVRLWRRARRTRQIPDREQLEKAKALVSYKNVKLERHHARVRLTKAGMKLDFGGIAKGYAADEALVVLKKRGISQALVAAAGDIACGDAPPNEQGWKVEVASLKHDQAEGPAPILLLSNRNVSTSGDTEQFVEIDGVRYSHIVDPRTGLGVVGRSSVTVVCNSGMMADGLATAASVIGPEAAMRLIDDTPETAALFVRVTDWGIESVASKRWPELPRLTPQHGKSD
jgi:thiamine biosynthesis lipoprotein